MTFVASNGAEVYRVVDGLSVSEYVMPDRVWQAAVEYARHLDDQRRGWWRSKVDPDVVIFTHQDDLFGVLDTGVAVPEALYLREETLIRNYAGVIKEYLADQKPTPKEGELWKITVDGDTFLTLGNDSGWFVDSTGTSWPANLITSSRRIYPEGD